MAVAGRSTAKHVHENLAGSMPRGSQCFVATRRANSGPGWVLDNLHRQSFPIALLSAFPVVPVLTAQTVFILNCSFTLYRFRRPIVLRQDDVGKKDDVTQDPEEDERLKMRLVEKARLMMEMHGASGKPPPTGKHGKPGQAGKGKRKAAGELFSCSTPKWCGMLAPPRSQVNSVLALPRLLLFCRITRDLETLAVVTRSATSPACTFCVVRPTHGGLVPKKAAHPLRPAVCDFFLWLLAECLFFVAGAFWRSQVNGLCRMRNIDDYIELAEKRQGIPRGRLW